MNMRLGLWVMWGVGVGQRALLPTTQLSCMCSGIAGTCGHVLRIFMSMTVEKYSSSGYFFHNFQIDTILIGLHK